MRYAPLAALVLALFPAALLARAQADNPQEHAKPELPEILPLWAPWQAALKAVAAERDKKLANLDHIYLLNLDKLMKERAEAGDLDGALAVKAESERLGKNQPTTDPQREAMPPGLRTLRASYDAALKGYLNEAARGADALLQKYLADLEGLQKRVTMTGDLQKALLVKAERDRCMAGASNPQPAPTPEVKVATVPVPTPVKVPPASPQTPAPAPRATSSGGFIEVTSEIRAKGRETNVVAGAIVFAGPHGDGRGGAKGVLLKNDPLTGRNGTTWSFRYTQRAAQGLQIIHPHGSGHMIGHLSVSGVGISTPQSWFEVGYRSGDAKRVKKARGFDEVFPLQPDAVYQVVSKLDGQGGYELTIDGKLVATARVTGTPALSFESTGKGEFKGDGLPLRWAAGYSALLLGPVDTGQNTCREVRFAATSLK